MTGGTKSISKLGMMRLCTQCEHHLVADMALVSKPETFHLSMCVAQQHAYMLQHAATPNMTKQVQDPQRVTELLAAAPLKDHVKK